MIGISLLMGTPLSPWQAPQIAAFAATGSAPCACRNGGRGERRAAKAPGSWDEAFACRWRRSRSIQRESDDRVAALIVELRVAAGGDDDKLLAIDGVG